MAYLDSTYLIAKEMHKVIDARNIDVGNGKTLNEFVTECIMAGGTGVFKLDTTDFFNAIGDNTSISIRFVFTEGGGDGYITSSQITRSTNNGEIIQVAYNTPMQFGGPAMATGLFMQGNFYSKIEPIQL